jgi:hypothetical protein
MNGVGGSYGGWGGETRGKRSPLARPGRKWETYQYGSLRNRLGRLGFI